MATRTDEQFGNLLRGYRLRARLSQAELAHKATLSVRTLRDLEQGRVARPQLRSVHRLIVALGLSTNDEAVFLAAVGAAVGEAGPRPDPDRLRVRALGPLTVDSAGSSAPVAAPMLRSLLGLLALRAPHTVTTDEIAAVLWGERPPRSAPSQIHVYVARLRQLLEPSRATREPARRLVREPGGYQLRLAVPELDVLSFRDRVHRAERAQASGDRVGASTAYAEALDLWPGPVLADVPALHGHPAVTALDRERIAAVLAYADVAGDADDAVRRLHAAHLDEPLHEGLATRLILALAAVGEQAAAIGEYERIRNRLTEELGIEPGPDLQAAYVRVLRQQVDRPAAAPEPAAAATVPRQLPAAASGFTGRPAQLAELDGLLAEPTGEGGAGIAAVYGTGGIGKTALALHWAHRVVERFPDGQLYVNLRGFQSGGEPMTPAEAVRGFLDALGVAAPRVPSSVDAQIGLYRSLLAGRRVLVVLDNARDADQVRPLLPGGPGPFTVVTSRDRLTGLVASDRAHPIALDGLTTVESRALLAHRLGDSRVAAEPEAVERVIAACARLPLALVIAAARARQSGFPLASLADELTRDGRRLDALDAGDRSSQLRAVFARSYAALTPPVARLFRLLGLHPGPDLSVSAVASLAGQPLPQVHRLLSELVRASLLTERVPGRFAVHDLLRLYAAELVRRFGPRDERRTAVVRMLDHYTHSAYAASLALTPQRPTVIPLAEPAPGCQPEPVDDHESATAWFVAEHAVLLAVQRLAAEERHDAHAWLLAWTLGPFHTRRGDAYGLITAWEVGGSAATRLDHPLARGYAERLRAHASIMLGRHDDAQARLSQVLELYGDGEDLVGAADTHRSLSYLCHYLDRSVEGLDHAERSLALYRAAGQDRGQACALNDIGYFHGMLGHHAEALEHCGRALALFRATDDRDGQAATLDSLGVAHHRAGQHDEAVECYREALALFRALGDNTNEAQTLDRLGDAYDAGGDRTAAVRAWQRALEIFTDLGHAETDAVRAKLSPA